MKRFFLCTLLFAAALAVNCTEDEPILFGDIYGTVTNSQTGEPVRNAQVILSPSGASTISGSDGRFEFRSLDAGQYSISVSSDGYEDNSRQVTVVPGQSTSCDIHLTPQAIVEIFNIDPLTLNFGTTQTQLAVTVTNDSPNETQWSLDLGQNTWLKASPIAGQLGAGKKQTIVFSANRAYLTQETSGIVTFSALGGSSSLTANCSPSQQVSSIMEVTPLDIDFGDLSTEQVFRIKNTSSALLNWTIFGIEAEALSVSDTSGSIQTGNAKVVAIKLDRSKMDGNHLTTSFMISDGTVDQQVNINVGSHESNVSNNPDQPTNEPMGLLELPSLVLDFGVDYKSLPFTINNAGDATLDWSIIDVQDEIFSFSPDSGTLEAGNSTEIQVSIDRENLPAGSAESAFTISDGVNKYVVTVKYEEPEYTDGKIKLTTDTVDFGTEETLLYFGVENVGTTSLSWTASDIPEYITFNYGHLTSKQGMESTINNRVELNRETMPDEVDTYITITNDYNSEDTHQIHITASKDGSGSSDGELQVSSSTLDFGTAETQLYFNLLNVRNSYRNCSMHMGGIPFAVNFSFESETLANNNTYTYRYRVDLNRSSMTGNIDVPVTISIPYGDGTTESTTVRITATQSNVDYSAGKISVSPTELDFSSDLNGTLNFSVTNTGTSHLKWTMTYDPEVLIIDSQLGGSITTEQNVGNTTQHRVNLYNTSKVSETYITLTNDINPSDTHQIHITISKDTSGGYDYTKGLIQVSPTTIDFGTTETKKAFSVTNIGPDWLEWDVTDLPEYLSVIDDQDVSIAGGAIQAGLTREFYFTLNRETMPDNVDAYIPIKNNYNSEDTHQVRITATKEGGSDSNNGDTSSTDIPNNQIWYTSMDNDVITPSTIAFGGAVIVSNVYENGKGIITFDEDVTTIGSNALSDMHFTYITIPNSVTTIESNAFGAYLYEFTVPESVVSIHEMAFSLCQHIYSFKGKFASSDNKCLIVDNKLIAFVNRETSYNIPEGVTAIGESAFNSKAITNITLPSSLLSIGKNAFRATPLTSITIPNSVTTIGDRAFMECSALTSANLPAGLTTMGQRVFYNCSQLANISIADGAKVIGNSAFDHCTSITNISIPNSVKTIDAGAFVGCTSLTNIAIPNSVTTLGSSAFSGCTKLSSVSLGSGISAIEGHVFVECTNLTNLTIPNNVSSIGEGAFMESGITSVNIHDNIQNIGNSAFAESKLTEIRLPGHIVYGTAICQGCINLRSVVMDSGITKVDRSWFYGCSSLKNVTIPNTVTSIEYSAFRSCTNLKDITLPNSVTYIGDCAFLECTAMTTFTIPESVTKIGDSYGQIFYHCTNLVSVYCKATTPPTWGYYASSVFTDNAPDRKIYVPTDSVDAYKTASGWSSLASDIVGYDF